MSNESKPSGSERLAQVLGEVDMDELEGYQSQDGDHQEGGRFPRIR